MKEKTVTQSNSKLLLVIMLLLVLIVATSIWLVLDLSKPISYKEVSKSGLAGFANAEEVTTGVTGKVIAKFVDTDGNELHESVTYEGKVGEEYVIDRPDIDGYLPYGIEPYQKTGNYQKDTVEVNFVYQSEEANVEINEKNNTITVKMKNSKEQKEYNLKIISKDYNGNLVKNIDYLVSGEAGAVVRKGTVESDTFVAGTLTVNQDGRDTYKIEVLNTEHWKPACGKAFDFSLIKSWNTSTKEYEISLDYNKGLEGVSIIIDGSDIIVTISNKKDADIPETPEIPDIPEEPIKIFDLSVDKFITKVKVSNNKGTTVINRDISKKDNLFKLEIAAKEVAQTKLEVTYVVKVENIGEVAGYATELMDFVPSDFKAIAVDGWELQDKTLVTRQLEDKLLNPGESAELELTFEWQLTEDNLGSRINQAEITEYKNDLNLRDYTDNNIGTAEMLVTIKTGAEEVCILAILATLTVVAIVLYKERKRITNDKEVR